MRVVWCNIRVVTADCFYETISAIGPLVQVLLWVIFDRGSGLCCAATSASPRKLTSGPDVKLVAMGPQADIELARIFRLPQRFGYLWRSIVAVSLSQRASDAAERHGSRRRLLQSQLLSLSTRP